MVTQSGPSLTSVMNLCQVDVANQIIEFADFLFRVFIVHLRLSGPPFSESH